MVEISPETPNARAALVLAREAFPRGSKDAGRISQIWTRYTLIAAGERPPKLRIENVPSSVLEPLIARVDALAEADRPRVVRVDFANHGLTDADFHGPARDARRSSHGSLDTEPSNWLTERMLGVR